MFCQASFNAQCFSGNVIGVLILYNAWQMTLCMHASGKAFHKPRGNDNNCVVTEYADYMIIYACNWHYCYF